ncbi:MAG: hypothetical protein GVY07_05480 [Bacteroidetes bacterium]|nr:hypothetical protein [Bacteroidota bacterium]
MVIESDDWGSIRMPSRKVYEKCLNAGYFVDRNPYEKYDSLASEDDLELLFELLSSFRDKKGKHPKITANILPVNPDFRKIRNSDFTKYYYESIKETFQRYPKHERCFQLWQDGMEKGIFYPQSHGREHLNVSMFMRALQEKDTDALFGFYNGMPGSMPRGNKKGKNKYVEGMRYTSLMDKENKFSIHLEGLKLFKSLMGYKSSSFMPQNYLWSPDFDKCFAKMGVKYYQGNRKMKEPGIKGNTLYHKHWLGKKNSQGQSYIIRNAEFEPSLFRKNVNEPVDKCLNEISIALMMNKPAVICSHRINYVGFIDKKNRDRNLRLLNTLLTAIKKKWPSVEFLTSCELGELISETN